MDRKLLDILCCPISKQPLAMVNTAELNALNTAIGSGSVRKNDETAQTLLLKQALITRDHKMIYRIEDDIPVLLEDEGIATSQIDDFPR
ncbi:MAG: Trm112 family protein [Arenimonas sp.]